MPSDYIGYLTMQQLGMKTMEAVHCIPVLVLLLKRVPGIVSSRLHTLAFRADVLQLLINHTDHPPGHLFADIFMELISSPSALPIIFFNPNLRHSNCDALQVISCCASVFYSNSYHHSYIVITEACSWCFEFISSSYCEAHEVFFFPRLSFFYLLAALFAYVTLPRRVRAHRVLQCSDSGGYYPSFLFTWAILLLAVRSIDCFHPGIILSLCSEINFCLEKSLLLLQSEDKLRLLVAKDQHILSCSLLLSTGGTLVALFWHIAWSTNIVMMYPRFGYKVIKLVVCHIVACVAVKEPKTHPPDVFHKHSSSMVNLYATIGYRRLPWITHYTVSPRGGLLSQGMYGSVSGEQLADDSSAPACSVEGDRMILLV